MRQATQSTEAELLKRARMRDSEACEILYVKYLKDSIAISGLLRRALVDAEDRKEMLHEIYVQLVCSNHPFRGEARLSTYIYKVARLTIFQKYRRENARKRRMVACGGTLEIEDVADASQQDPETNCLIQENRRLVLQRIAGLPDAYRDVIRLRVVHEMSYEQIAGQMQLPVNTVSTKIHKGKKLLQAVCNG